MLSNEIYSQFYLKAPRKKDFNLSWLRSCYDNDAYCHLWFLHWGYLISNTSRYYYSSNPGTFAFLSFILGRRQSQSND
jgi:hypothetical protein